MHWRAIFAAIVSLTAYWMVVWAMTQAPIALVAALRETSIIIATMIGTFYFKEKSGYRRFVAAFVICMSISILKLND
jgi:drug/metabolite transporter (DMT)-like permease